jgi:hypothetical protein
MPQAHEVFQGYAERTNSALAALQAGRFAEAAPTFEWAGLSAQSVDDIINTNIFGSSAVEAYAKAGDMQNALRVATQIVGRYHALGNSPELARFMRFVLKPLRRDGYEAAAGAIAAQVATATSGAWSDPEAPKLPAFCSNCGAPVKPAEVVRPTPTTVACHFCGASLDRR